jgi:4-hydroxybenzoate polyprenyltransferase
MTDREDDIAAGAKSSAILFGESDRLIVGILQGLFLLDLALVGQRAGLGAAFYLSLVIAGGLVAYQLWLIRDREPQACFKAFLNNHWLGLIVFVGIALNYAWSPS